MEVFSASCTFSLGIAALATILEYLFKVRKGINWIFLAAAVGVDQGIKAYLFSLEWESISIPLIEPVFYIEPTHNTLGSYLWVLLGLKEGIPPAEYHPVQHDWRPFYRNLALLCDKKTKLFLDQRIYSPLPGRTAANLIDNAFWGGSLDYITIKPFYTFDLKDLYITLCELFLITELIDNHLLKTIPEYAQAG